MSNHTHQRKLRRIFGKQPVGSVVGPRQPEAGIAGRVIPSHSPRRTFSSLDDGDLAIWRLWSRVTTGFQPAHSSPGSTSDSPPPSVRTLRGSPQPHLRTNAKPSLPRATIQASPPVPPLRIVKPHLSSLKQRRTYKINKKLNHNETKQL